eukprot:12527181-Ditylum_brightwellii.AAC.1
MMPLAAPAGCHGVMTTIAMVSLCRCMGAFAPATILLWCQNAISGTILTGEVVGETWEERWRDKR